LAYWRPVRSSASHSIPILAIALVLHPPDRQYRPWLTLSWRQT